jgi:type IV pilus modification protein PilV
MDKKGFTLIEVMIGLVLLAIGLLAIAGMQLSSVRGNFFSGNLTQASILAQDRLEGLRQVDFGAAALSAGSHDEGTIAGTIFTRRYVVTVVPGTTMLNITVTVNWRDSSDHSISFTTVRAQ